MDKRPQYVIEADAPVTRLWQKAMSGLKPGDWDRRDWALASKAERKRTREALRILQGGNYRQLAERAQQARHRWIASTLGE